MELSDEKRLEFKNKKQFELSELIDVLETPSKDKTKQLVNLLYKKIEPQIFKIYKPPSASMSGKSGAIIMIDTKEKPIKTIMKQMKASNRIKIKDGNCIKTSNSLNEILVNLVLNNLEQFITETEKLNVVKDYIIELIGFGSEKKNTYIIQEAVGIHAILVKKEGYSYYSYIEGAEEQEKKHLTNLHDIFVHNYIPILIELCKDYDLNKMKIDLFMKYIIHMISLYFDVLTILNENVGFCHGDMKLTNVFIKKKTFTENNDFTTEDIQNLRDANFIIDILPVISDLDRSRIYIKDHTISSIPSGQMGLSRSKRLQTLGISKTTYKSRYKCSKDSTIKCHSVLMKTSSLYTTSYYDSLCILLNILILFDIEFKIDYTITTILKYLYKKNGLLKISTYLLSKFNTDITKLNQEYINKMFDAIIKKKHSKHTTYDLLHIKNNHVSANILGNMAQDFLCRWTKNLKTKRIGGSRKKIRQRKKKTKKNKIIK